MTDMTFNKIIKLAQEAGFQIETDWAGRPSVLVIKDGGVFLCGADEIVRFYHIVRNTTLEEAAEEADRWQTALHDPRYECDCATAIRALKEQS